MTHEFQGWTPPPGVAVVAPPVHSETIVDAIYSDRSEESCIFAHRLNWSAVGDGPAIVAFAVVSGYKPAFDEGWSDWRTDVSEWNVSTHDVRFECIGGIHRISTRPRSEVMPAAREVVAWSVVRGSNELTFGNQGLAEEWAAEYGGTVVRLSGVMPHPGPRRGEEG